MEPLTRFWNQARTFWGGLSAVRRVLIVGAGVVVLAAVGAFAYFNQSGEGVPLYPGGLAEEDVAAVTTALREQNIPYTLKDSHTIHVPKERLAAARVALAAAGVPARGGGKGFELWDKSNFTATPFEQNVNYVRALQVELARSIMQIEAVASARVIIARPDPTPFVRDQRPPTASVVLKLKANATFSKANAASVVQLVSMSVDGLKPENVTVVDSTGRMLSRPPTADRDDAASGLFEQQQKVEGHLAGKVQEMLTAHLGVGRAVVTVQAELDPRKIGEKRTEYPKDGGAVKSERSQISKTVGGQRGGPVGTASNVQRSGGGVGVGGGSSEETTQTDYNSSVMVREMEQRMGAVTRLTVAVLADLTPPAVAEGQPAVTPITQTQVEQLVRDAVGTSDARGDRVTVVNGRLGGPPPAVNEPDEETLNIQRMSAYVELARNISLAVAVAMAVGVAALFVIRRRPKAGKADADADAAAGGPPPSPEEKRQELLARFIDTARTDPSRTAAAFGLLLGPAGG